MISTAQAEDAPSLIQVLRDLDRAYRIAVDCADDVIAALASGDCEQIQVAVAAQDAALQAIVGVERRRRVVARDLESRLDEGNAPAYSADPAPLFSDGRLLASLPPDEAQFLRAARHDLLLTLRDLQSRNDVATTMLQNAQTVMKRLSRSQATVIGYGPDGEPVLLGRPPQRRAARRA